MVRVIPPVVSAKLLDDRVTMLRAMVKRLIFQT
jgi:hypothetical protein